MYHYYNNSILEQGMKKRSSNKWIKALQKAHLPEKKKLARLFVISYLMCI